MTHQILQEAARTRRSVYALNKNLPLPAEEVAAIVEHAVLHTPSSFNSQSTRRQIRAHRPKTGRLRRRSRHRTLL